MYIVVLSPIKYQDLIVSFASIFNNNGSTSRVKRLITTELAPAQSGLVSCWDYSAPEIKSEWPGRFKLMQMQARRKLFKHGWNKP